MTIHKLQGFGFIYDETLPNEPNVSFNPEVSLNIVTPDSATSLSYTILNVYGTNEFAEVDIDIDDIYVSFNGVSPDFLEAGGDIIEASVGQITWGGGNVTQLLQIDIDIGDEVVNFIFRLGGATLPTFTTLAEFDAFGNSIAGIEVIPAGTPLSAGVDIPFTTIPGWTSISDTMINGTAGDDTLTGTAGNDVINPGANDGYDEIHGTSGDDVIVFSDSMMGDFYGITYEGLSGPINVTISDEYGQATVDKGADGTDLLIDILQAADWNTGDGVSLTGTNANDVFNLTMPEDSSWVGISGRGGNDTFNLYAGAIFRLDYRDGATTGINANLGTGVITDGQGGTDQVNYMSADVGRVEVRATHFDDTILGTNLDERFILLGGNDSLNAGGGVDTIRYDRDGAAGLVIDLAAGVATGTWNGQSFNHQISGIESVYGSRDWGYGDDHMTGDANANYFRGNEAADTLFGAAGDDSLDGGTGNDRLDGGSGYDTAFFSGYLSQSWITNTANGVVVIGPEGIDVVTNVEWLSFWDGGIDVSTLGLASNTATTGSDVLVGASGAASIFGQAGDDYIFGLEGNDTLAGGDGNDFIAGFDGNDRLFGGAGNDSLYGDNGDDYINPGDNMQGYDSIRAGAGNDTIDYGGVVNGYVEQSQRNLNAAITANVDGNANTGSVNKGANGTTTMLDVMNPMLAWGLTLTSTHFDDTFNMTVADGGWAEIYINGGSNTINLGASTGTLRLTYMNSNMGMTADLGAGVVTTSMGTDTISNPNNSTIELRATDFDDSIMGSAADERFILEQGYDTVNGGAGFDTLRYDRGGVDAITANLLGGVVTGTWDGLFFSHEISNIEAIRGSGMGDTLTGNYGANKMEGGEGDDSMTGLSGNDTLLGEDGNDTIFGNYGNDSIAGNWGDDSLDGGAGYDTIDAGLGNDTVNGGDGRDKVLLGAGADLYLDNAQGGINGQDTVYGNQGNDTIQGGNGNDVFYGGLDNDVIYGQLGADMLFGEAGYDTLYSGDGNDTVNGGDGRDLVFMGTGADIYFDNGQGGTNGQDTVYGNQGNDTIQGGNGNDMFYGGLDNDVIFGRLGADKLYGEDGFDTIYAGDGNDTVNGGNGRDVVFMGNGNDLYRDNAQGGNFGRDNVWAGSGDDTIQGGNGNDTFGGGAGDDLIIARLGDDRLDGGAGYDRLSGGDGADTFVFSTNFGEDAITDFTKGVDRLELDDALWTGTLTAAEVVAQFGDDTSGFVTLDFSTATEINYIIFEGLTSLDGIADTIDIV